jgi:ABC-2 type transport system permease protein
MDAIISIVPTETVYSLVFVAVLILGAAGILYNSTKSILAAVALGIVGVAAAVGLYFINNLIYDGFIAKALNWFSVFARFDNLTSGVFHISDVVYYISFALLFMYLTVNVIEKRRWR